MFTGDLKSFLEDNYRHYNQIDFIESDPVSLPHKFTLKEDIEISGFLSATIAWGQRNTILKNGSKLLHLLDDAPYHFLMHAGKSDLHRFENFVHRTFNGIDCTYFIKSLINIYRQHNGLEQLFTKAYIDSEGDMAQTIAAARKVFLSYESPGRTSKHFADPSAGSTAKRINMYLRWMVRTDKRGVDFGIWKKIKPANLYCPLDVHSGRIARELGLLRRKQNDWKAVEELTANLRLFDSNDPVKYDYTLFGIGVSNK